MVVMKVEVKTQIWDEDLSNEFLELSNICAIIPEHSVDWFIKIIGEFESTADVTDDYRHKVISGQKYMLGHFLQKVNDNMTSEKKKLTENFFSWEDCISFDEL